MSLTTTMSTTNYLKVNHIRTNLLIIINQSLHVSKREICINSQSSKQLAQRYDSYQICIDNPVITGFPTRMGSQRNFKGLFNTPENKATKEQKSNRLHAITSSIKSKKCDISNKKRKNSPYNGIYTPIQKPKETEEEVQQSQFGLKMLQKILMNIKALHPLFSLSTKDLGAQVFPKIKKKKAIKEVKEFNMSYNEHKKGKEKDQERKYKIKMKIKDNDHMNVIHLFPTLPIMKYNESDDDDDDDDEDNNALNCFDIKIQI